MIRSFSDTETERFYATGKSRRLPTEILKRAAMRLMQVDAAARIEDLHMPPSNRLEALSHDPGSANGASASTTNGAYVSASRTATPLTLKSSITIEE